MVLNFIINKLQNTRRKQEEIVKLCQESNEIVGAQDESKGIPRRGRRKKTIDKRILMAERENQN